MDICSFCGGNRGHVGWKSEIPVAEAHAAMGVEEQLLDERRSNVLPSTAVELCLVAAEEMISKSVHRFITKGALRRHIRVGKLVRCSGGKLRVGKDVFQSWNYRE